MIGSRLRDAAPAASAVWPGSAPVAPARLDQRRAPFVAALAAYQAAGTTPFSTPGHKLGSGADGELRALLGDAVFAADVWLNTGDHDRALRAAETLAAATWGADRSFFLTNGSSAGNQATPRHDMLDTCVQSGVAVIMSS
jgi:arginine/lysine/ornithine decarboxylase